MSKMKASEIIQSANSKLYEEDYADIVMRGGFLNRWVYQKTHKDLEFFNNKLSDTTPVVLELGAQADQHRKWVKNNYEKYIVSDVNFEPLVAAKISEESIQASERSSVKSFCPEIFFQEIDAEKIEYGGETFDRIVATCLVVHLDQPIDAFEEWRRVIKDGGCIDFYVPCEPGLILRLARNVTHKRKNLRVDFPYDLLHYSQHKNHFPAINEFVKYIFANDVVRKRYFPFRFLSWNCNLWAIYSIRVKK